MHYNKRREALALKSGVRFMSALEFEASLKYIMRKKNLYKTLKTR
jgi:hypothetical protein